MRYKTCHLLTLVLASTAFLSPAAGQGTGQQISLSTFYVPINDMPVGSGLATLNGNVYLGTPQIEVCLGADPDYPTTCPDKSLFGLQLEGGFSLEVACATGGAASLVIPLGSVQVASIAFPSAPGVLGQVVVSADLHLAGEFEAGVVTSFVGHFDAASDHQRNKKGKQVSGFRAPSNVFMRFTPPEVTGSTGLQLSAWVAAEVSVAISASGIPLLEPYLAVESGVAFAVDPTGNPWWEADGFVGLEAGFKGGLLPGTNIALSPQVFTFDIVDAGGDLASWIPRPLRLAKAIDLSNFEDATAMMPHGQGYLVVGNSEGALNRGWIAELDEDGQALWQKRTTTAAFVTQRPTDVFTTTSGEYVMAGNRLLGSEPRLIVFEPNSEPLWSRTYLESGGFMFANDFHQTADGGYLFAGTVQRGLVIHPMVVRLEADGDVQWASEFEVTGLTHSGRAYEVIETSLGEVVVVGEVDWANADPVNATISNQNAFLWRLDAGGTTLAMRVLGGVGTDSARCVVELDNGLIALGGRTDVNTEEHAGWLAVVDGDGNLLWSRSIAGEVLSSNTGSGDSGNELLTGLASVPGGMLVSATSGAGTPEESWLLEFNRNGTLVWFKSLRAPGEDELAGLVALEDGILTWGRTRSLQPLGLGSAEDEMWFARTGHDGMLDFEPGNAYDALNDLPSVVDTTAILVEDLPGVASSFFPTWAAHAMAFETTSAVLTELTD